MRYELRSVDGEYVGTFTTNLSDWWPGMEFRGHGNRHWRIVAIDPDTDEWKVEAVQQQR
jgi:hypothetical protein